MKCPDCGTALEDQAGKGAGDPTMQRCRACGGVWIGRESVEGAHAGIWGNLKAMGVDSIEALGDRMCPRCSVSLAAVCPHDHPELRIDRCGSCHGVWLDRGEQEKLRRILADHEDTHGVPKERPPHWSMMKWMMYRTFERMKGAYDE